jgi:sporulation integral membrane protein YtvI
LPALRQIFAFLLPILAPFLIGWLIAALMEPLVVYLEKGLRIKRGLAAFITLISLLALLISIIALSISWVSVEVVKLSKELPAILNVIMDFSKDLFAQIQSYYSEFNLGPRLLEGLSQSLSTIFSGVSNVTSGATNLLLGTATVLPNILILLIISLMASFFFSRDKQVMASIIERLLPATMYDAVQAIKEDMGKAIIGYIRAQITLLSITALQTLVGLYLIGVEYAVTMAIVVGVLDILPVVGSGSVYIPWMIYELFLGNFSLAIGLAVIYGLIIVVRQVLEPKLVADNLGIHPLPH